MTIEHFRRYTCDRCHFNVDKQGTEPPIGWGKALINLLCATASIDHDGWQYYTLCPDCAETINQYINGTASLTEPEEYKDPY